MPVLVWTPILCYINRGQIRSGLISYLCILHTFLGSFNNVNYMDSGLLQQFAYCLDYIYEFLVITYLFHIFIFH